MKLIQIKFGKYLLLVSSEYIFLCPVWKRKIKVHKTKILQLFYGKGKIVPVLFLNWGPRYEGVLGGGVITPFILWPQH